MPAYLTEEHKQKLAEGRARANELKRMKKEGIKMPFLKRRMEDDEPPAERVERTERIVNEARGEPKYVEEEVEHVEEPVTARPRAPSSKPTAVTLKVSFAELREDGAAHMFLVNTVAARLSGLPPHLVEAETQRLCAGSIQRLKDIDAVLKQYAGE